MGEEGSDFSASESGYTVVPFTAIAKAGGGGGKSGHVKSEMSVNHLKGDVNSKLDM